MLFLLIASSALCFALAYALTHLEMQSIEIKEHVLSWSRSSS